MPAPNHMPVDLHKHPTCSRLTGLNIRDSTVIITIVMKATLVLRTLYALNPYTQ